MPLDVELTSHAEEVKDAMLHQLFGALETIGLVGEGYAKRLCPVDTGRLRNSISHAVDEEEQAAYIGTNVEYAPFVEFGTSRQKAQPYLKPAAEDHGDEYRSIVENALKSED